MSSYDIAGKLFGRTRSEVLAILALAPEIELHVREIARRSRLDPSGVLRELRLLERHGILAARQVGRQKLYRLNPDSPVYPELAGIMRKTAGLADIIRQALQPLEASIELAYIYGSMATGLARPDSDVDVMIVGPVSGMDVAAALAPCYDHLRRNVNATHYPVDEYWGKVKLGRGFPFTAHAGAKIILMGAIDEPR